MVGPIDAITAFHNAFRRDMTTIDAAALALARGDASQESNFRRFHFFNEMLVWHADAVGAVGKEVVGQARPVCGHLRAQGFSATTLPSRQM